MNIQGTHSEYIIMNHVIAGDSYSIDYVNNYKKGLKDKTDFGVVILNYISVNRYKEDKSIIDIIILDESKKELMDSLVNNNGYIDYQVLQRKIKLEGLLE